jgi:hypothetical protein
MSAGDPIATDQPAYRPREARGSLHLVARDLRRAPSWSTL